MIHHPTNRGTWHNSLTRYDAMRRTPYLIFGYVSMYCTYVFVICHGGWSLHTYIYVYICMYVCMCVCMQVHTTQGVQKPRCAHSDVNKQGNPCDVSL